jgi:hypothetical protein
MSAVGVGQTSTQVVRARNAGDGRLQIVGLVFSNSLSGLEFTKEHPELPIYLGPDEEIEITVNYTPQDPNPDQGKLIFESNSIQGQVTQVDIITEEGRSDLFFAPESTFSLNVCDTEMLQNVPFQNLGASSVNVTQMQLSTDSDSNFSIQGALLTLLDGTEERIDINAPFSIPSGSTLNVEIQYQKEGQGDAIASLELDYESTLDPENYSPYRVLLKGVELTPTVAVVPQNIEFGAYDIGETSEAKEVVLTNTGIAPLDIETITLAVNDPALNAQFEIEDIDLPVELAPDQSIRFSVTYTPAMEGGHRTSISVGFGECQGQISIPMGGRVREPCLSLNPEMINFGVVAQGQLSAPYRAELFNCGDTQVDITEVMLSQMDPNLEWRWTNPNLSLPFTLDPRTNLAMDVQYNNTNLEEGQTVQNSLQISNNSPTSNLELPIVVRGGGVPTCDLLVLPDPVNFGLVARGGQLTKEVFLFNRGTGRCELREQSIEPLFSIPLPGFSEVRFRLDSPAQGNEILPGQRLPVQITYEPTLLNADSAVYQVAYYDSFLSMDKMATATLSGVSGVSNIEVIPSRLDFGRVTAGECASREERVSVYNTGVVNLCIQNIELLNSQGDFCEEVFITDRPIADENGCIVVTRNQPADVFLVYEPGNLGEDTCELIFTSDASDQPELRVPIAGEGVSTSRQVDDFVQTSGQTVDVLFIIDNSGSMSEEQENLDANFSQFIQGAQQFENDYQIGVVTTDMVDGSESGRLQGPRIVRRGPNVENEFGSAASVGTSGAGEEKGLEAAKAALSDPLIFDTGVSCQSDADCVEPDQCIENVCGGQNRGFLRQNAALELVFVSDEDDFSDGSLNFYVDFFKNIKGFRNESLFHANAIVGASNGRASNCSGSGGDATAGSRYVEVAQRTNGRIYSICEENFGGPLQEIGNQAFGLPVQFFLTRPADPSTLDVQVDEQNRASGWMYDNASNSVIFDESTVPQPNQRVRIAYDAQCFPRQNN